MGELLKSRNETFAQGLEGKEQTPFLIQASSRKSMRDFLRVWSGCIEGFQENAVRYVLDVDPLDV